MQPSAFWCLVISCLRNKRKFPTFLEKKYKLSEEVGGWRCDKGCNKDCWRVLWDVSPPLWDSQCHNGLSCRARAHSDKGQKWQELNLELIVLNVKHRSTLSSTVHEFRQHIIYNKTKMFRSFFDNLVSFKPTYSRLHIYFERYCCSHAMHNYTLFMTMHLEGINWLAEILWSAQKALHK